MRREMRETLGFDVTPKQRYASPETIFFWLAKAPSIVFWTASYFKNGLFAYGKLEEQLLERITKAARLSEQPYRSPELSKTLTRPQKKNLRETGFKDHGEVVLYDFTRKHEAFALDLQKKAPRFIYRKPESLSKLLEALEEFRATVRQAYAPYTPNQRRGLLMFIMLDKASLNELHQDELVKARLESLFSGGAEERIYPILCVENASDLTAALVKESQSSIFLEEANETLAKAFYKVNVVDKNYGAVKVGLSWDMTLPDSLRRVSAVKLEREQWVIDKQAAMKKQDEEWLLYLEKLSKERDGHHKET